MKVDPRLYLVDDYDVALDAFRRLAYVKRETINDFVMDFLDLN